MSRKIIKKKSRMLWPLHLPSLVEMRNVNDCQVMLSLQIGVIVKIEFDLVCLLILRNEIIS